MSWIGYYIFYNLIQLCSEEVADNPVQAHDGHNGVGGKAEVINQLIEGIPRRTPLGEDRFPLPVVRPRHVGDDGDGPSGTRMDPMLGDLHDASWDVLEACGDCTSPRIHRVYGDSGSFQKGLDLRLQV